jgi:small subunit ribosomal protein S35
MGEQHPAEKKIVMEFCTRDMRDLSPVQRSKLQKIAGVRYNPETDIVRMSCESFPSQAQNKRYLGDLVNNMLREARVCDQPS